MKQPRKLTALLVFLVAQLACSLFAQSPPGSKLIVKITDARNTNGNLGVGLFKSAQGFPEDASKVKQGQNVAIDPKTRSAQVMFTNVPPGTYAVSARHDENANGKLDKNMVGYPKEGYAISNNPKPKLRPPTFNEAQFSVNLPEQTIEIKLLYR